MDHTPLPTHHHAVHTHQYATIRRRYFASIIDGTILLVFIYLVVYPALGIDLLNLVFTASNKDFLDSLQKHQTVANLVYYGFTALYTIGFAVYSQGSTPGQKLFKIRFVKENGQPVTLVTMIIRYFMSFVSSLILGIGYLWAIFDSRKQTLHDKVAGTVVIEEQTRPSYPLITILTVLACIISVSLSGALLTKAFMSGFEQARQSRTISSATLTTDELPPKALEYRTQSLELFEQMKKSTDVAEVRKLNDRNIIILKQAINVASDSATLWNDLSSAYTWVSTDGTLDDGVAAAKRAVDLDPDNFALKNNYANYLVKVGQYDQAVIEYKDAARIAETGYGYQGMGDAYVAMQLPDQAVTSYEKSITIYEKQNTKGDFDEDILLVQKKLQSVKNTVK